jgi:hypothetical protein
MNLKDLKQELIYMLDARIAAHIKSSPGRGKSELVEDLVKELSIRDGKPWGFTTLFLATMTPTDMMGYMVPARQEDGTMRSEWTTPTWMITPEGKHINEFERGIVFMDEYGQGDGDTKRVSAQLKLRGEVGPHRLHPGIGIICASNFSTDRSGVTKDFDFCINREGNFTVTDDINCLLEWMAVNNILPLTQAFAAQNPHIVFTEGVPEKQGPWCTPRSLVMADKLLKLVYDRTGGSIETPQTLETVSGIIGAGAAAQYFAFVKLEREMPKFEKIIADPKGVKVPSKPDAMMLVAYNLAHRVTEEHIAPVVQYVERLPKEFGVTFIKVACQRNNKIVATPAVQKWALENSSLMASIAKPQ